MYGMILFTDRGFQIVDGRDAGDSCLMCCIVHIVYCQYGCDMWHRFGDVVLWLICKSLTVTVYNSSNSFFLNAICLQDLNCYK